MRIIGGQQKGIHLKAPDHLPVRPTTDQAKEALFNILTNTFDLEQCHVLDLFAGTGSVSIEFASRGAASVRSVDKHPGCVKWINAVKERYQLTTLNAERNDVFKVIAQTAGPYDIIFADPPYDLPSIPNIAKLIATHGLLGSGGLLIIEHPKLLKLDNQPGYESTRSYGNSSFSFFRNN